MTAEVREAGSAREVPIITKGVRNYALGMLVVVYIFNFIDRQILNILQPAIRLEFGLMDWQLGLLTGFAFAIFYTVLGIPIARLADHYSRRNIIAISLAIWSGMTALSGAALNFWHLLIARIGVGVGEAGCSPPAHSLISDLFGTETRATALSIYALGIPMGVFFGYALGGELAESVGWRWTFAAVGIPGVILAIIVRLTLVEPPRGHADGYTSDAPPPPVMAVFQTLKRRKSFLHLAMAGSLHAFVGYGVGNFFPEFLFRFHDMNFREIGWTLALISAFAGGTGTFLGGYVADRLAKRDRRWYMWSPGIATFVAVPIAIPAYLLDNTTLVIALLVLPVLLGAMYLGPTFSMTQSMVSVRMRALAAAILLFILNIIGLGIGPVLVGGISDYLHEFTVLGDQSLRYAMLIVALANVWATIHYFLAARTIRDDLQTAELEAAGR